MKNHSNLSKSEAESQLISEIDDLFKIGKELISEHEHDVIANDKLELIKDFEFFLEEQLEEFRNIGGRTPPGRIVALVRLKSVLRAEIARKKAAFEEIAAANERIIKGEI